ncbi:MAG TPA: SDR family oxidoreductase [Gemmatimonadaceae bacterium]|nr:SDR family oxidoreductase [Gemmatimonadaceae bacterium]
MTSSPRSADRGSGPPRTALVTGAGRRVGRAIAVALGGRGMRVAVHYHQTERGAQDTVHAIVEAGGDAFTIRVDLGEAGAPARLIAEAVDRLGSLDVLVNSAAVMIRTPFGEVTERVWDEIFALNLRAPFFCAQAAAPRMRDGGVIINIADLAAFESWTGYIPHGASKAGVVHITRAMAKVLGPRLRVNAIAPGAVLLPDDWSADDAERLARTTPLGRIGSPDDVTQAVLYLIDADYVTGQTLIVDGGRDVR